VVKISLLPIKGSHNFPQCNS